MHEPIRNFYLEGAIREEGIEQEKSRIEDFLRHAMRDEGFVEILDMDPQWTLKYDFHNSVYDFQLTMYGAEVKEEWRVAGLMNGKALEKSTVSPKSNQYSPTWDLT